jgi:hypothetical protein
MIQLRSILLILALSAPPSLASAQAMNFEDATAILGKSCGEDIESNCRGVNLDPIRLRDCLARNQDSVSAQCKSDYVRVFAAIQKRIAARAAVPKICEREVSKLCGGLQKGDSRALECILGETRGVSARCNQAISDAGYR